MVVYPLYVPLSNRLTSRKSPLLPSFDNNGDKIFAKKHLLIWERVKKKRYYAFKGKMEYLRLKTFQRQVKEAVWYTAGAYTHETKYI